ncbi:reverse transcriptase (RNA-dependent DNA polymerase) [Azospirillum brasilense]|jgi:Reverse transcriptase (RNA-dependent DNA polymerase).|nr:reverse transcriptase (RNA-dependent DNA polymerase) [Azospirillum brasilense]
MENWRLKERDLKKYPHFDPIISIEEAEALATDPERVAKHAFFPLMRYVEGWNRFAKLGQKGEAKERPIRYAARRDAYIYQRYREILSSAYERELTALGLSDNIIAYRRIPSGSGNGGKCNIHFAFDAFQRIRQLDNCNVIALDISKYYESLDHSRIKEIWCRLIKSARLPRDHFQVFKSITNYSYVEKQEAYARLGYFGEKRKTNSGKTIHGYLTPYNETPKHLCKGYVFREKLAGAGRDRSIIHKNYLTYGIPQGAPISDVIANFYLIEFDFEVSELAKKMGGYYYRYSDDIILIVPRMHDDALALTDDIRLLIKQHGAKLEIKEKKSSVFHYYKSGKRQFFSLVKGEKGKNGIEYLGFRYDGNYIYLRDSTLSNLYRKIVRAVRHSSEINARRFPNKGENEILESINVEEITKLFGKVERFDEKSENYRSWTFWTYARRAREIMGDLGKPILHQVKSYNDFIERRAKLEAAHAVRRREGRKQSVLP